MVQLEHIGVAIPRDAGIVDLFERILQRPIYKTEAVSAEDVETHFLNVGGAKLELLAPLSDAGDSAIARFLARRGPGLHHLAFEVADIEAVFGELAAPESGFELASRSIVDGADGKRVFFLHPRSTSGVLIEFCQSAKTVLHETQINVDGRELAKGEAGRAEATSLLVLGPALSDPGVVELVRAFESTHRLVVLAPATDTFELPTAAQLDQLGIPIEGAAVALGCGPTLPTQMLARGFRPLVAFSEHAVAEPGNTDLRHALLVYPSSMISKFADVTPPNCAFLPVTSAKIASRGVRVALPLIQDHLRGEQRT